MEGAQLLSGGSEDHRLLAAGRRVAEELALDCALADVVRKLDGREIESLLLKGPALAHWLYEDPSERPYGDIDLLVPPAQFQRAERCLAELGFSRRDTELRPQERPQHHENWVSPGRYQANLELHHTLRLLSVPPERVWEQLSENTESLEVAGTAVRIPGVSARALIVALHAAQHGRLVEGPIHDLERALLVTNLSTWKEAVTLARRLDCLAAFAAGLQLTPRGRALALRLGIQAQETNRFLRLRLATAPDTAAGIDALLTTSGVLPRLRLVGRELAPSRSFMRANYSLARNGLAGLISAYLLRPLHLAVALPRGLLAWLRAAIPTRQRDPNAWDRIRKLWKTTGPLDIYFGDLANEPLANAEQVFFGNMQLPNGTYKTTSDHRLDDVNRLVTEWLPRGSMLKIMDVAVSSGISTAEWSDHLSAHGIPHEMTAGDLEPEGLLLAIGARIGVLWQPDGEPLAVQVGGKCVYLRPSRRGDALLRVPFRLLFSVVGRHRVTDVAGSLSSGRVRLVRVALVSRRVLARPTLRVMRDDIRDGTSFVACFHICRAANILNRDYFTDDDLRVLAANLVGRLQENGLLIVCRSVEVRGEQINRASILRKTSNGMQLVGRLNMGSDVEDLLLDVAGADARSTQRNGRRSAG